MHAYAPACRVQVPTYVVARVLSIAGARSAEGVRKAPGGRLWGGVIRYVAFCFQGARSPCAIQSRTTRNKIGPRLRRQVRPRPSLLSRLWLRGTLLSLCMAPLFRCERGRCWCGSACLGGGIPCTCSVLTRVRRPVPIRANDRRYPRGLVLVLLASIRVGDRVLSILQ